MKAEPMATRVIASEICDTLFTGRAYVTLKGQLACFKDDAA